MAPLTGTIHVTELVPLRRRPRSAALMRLGYRVAYRVLQARAFVFRPRVRGVMCVLVDGHGRVLLVRHTYGDRRAWELPGGHARAGEDVVDAARRETREELGVDLADWRPLGALDGVWHFKREHLEFCLAGWPGGPAALDPIEIAEARWFHPASLPATLGDGSSAVLATVLR